MGSLKNLPLAIVTWKDHTSCDEWISEGDYARIATLSTISSVGWIREETDEKIVLVSAIDKECGSYGAIQTIGKGLVEHIKVLRGAKNAVHRGDEQVQERKAAQRQQERPEGKEPKAGSGDHAQREAGKQVKA